MDVGNLRCSNWNSYFFQIETPLKVILHAKRMKTGHQIEFHVCMCLCAKKKNREKTLHRCKFKVIPY